MGWGTWIGGALGMLSVLLAGAFALQCVNEFRDGRRFPAPGQLVDIGGGRRLHILCKGAASGPTVVIEQGLAGPSILWWPVQDAVAAFARVCTYDRAGYQWSDAAAGAQSVHASVADLHALLMAAAVPRPYVLVGHSFGGPLVRLFTREHPDDVVGLVLVDTPDDGVVARESFVAYARSLRRMFVAMKIAASVGLMRFVMKSQEAPLALPPRASGVLAAKAGTSAFFRTAVGNAHALELMAAGLREGGGFGLLGDRPLSVITHGIPFLGPSAVLEEGWSEGQRILAALSSNSELVVARHSNHMIHNDEPDVVVAAIHRVFRAARDHTPLSE